MQGSAKAKSEKNVFRDKNMMGNGMMMAMS